MAKMKNGTFGAPSGKLGKEIIFSSWNGEPYIKSNPGKRKKPNEKEKKNHQSFGKTTWGFINPLKDLFQISFKEGTVGNRGMFTARNYLMTHAMEKDAEGNAFVLPEKMLISKGSIPQAAEIQMQQISQGELVFSWNPKVSHQNATSNDQVLMVAYNVEAEKAVFSIGPAFRRDATASLDVGNLPSGTAHIYFGLLSFDRTRASDSVYLGTVEV